MTTATRPPLGRTTQAVSGPRRGDPVVESDHAVWLVTAVAAFAAAVLGDAQPTGVVGVDLIYRGAAVAVLVRAGARTRRRHVVVLNAIALAVTASLVLQVLASIAFLASILHLRRSRRSRPLGALVTAVGGLALLDQVDAYGGPLRRLSDGRIADLTGFSVVLAAIAVAPLLRSAWRRTSRQSRRRLRRATTALVVLAAGATATAGGAFAWAASDTLGGVAEIRRAATHATDADLETSLGAFEAASAHFERAEDRISGPWMLPARLVPIVAQHVEVGQLTVAHGREVTSVGTDVIRLAVEQPVLRDGRIDVDAFDAATPVVDAFSSTLVRAIDEIETASTPWLVPPVADRIERATARLEPAVADLEHGSEAMERASTLLARPTPARVLFVFTTPAEARGLGGFAGHWVEVRFDDGTPSIERQFRSKDLNDLLEHGDPVLRSTPDFVERYGRFDIEHHIQDVTITPDGPTAAETAADLYAQAVGEPVDAVLFLDPFVIDRLLAHSGPIDVDDVRLASGSAATLLLSDQYALFEGREADREALLTGLAPALVEQLLAGDDVYGLGRSMWDMAELDRLVVWLADDPEQSMDALDLSAPFVPDDAVSDVLGVVHQNGAQNKIDSLLDRRIDITTNRRGATIEHRATLTLTNRATAGGHPDAVIGSNDQGLEPGTNLMTVSWYSRLPVTEIAVDGTPVPAQYGREFDLHVTSIVLAVPAESSTVVSLQAAGEITAEEYELSIPVQPHAGTSHVRAQLVDSDTNRTAAVDTTDGLDLRLGFDAD